MHHFIHGSIIQPTYCTCTKANDFPFFSSPLSLVFNLASLFSHLLTALNIAPAFPSPPPPRHPVLSSPPFTYTSLTTPTSLDTPHPSIPLSSRLSSPHLFSSYSSGSTDCKRIWGGIGEGRGGRRREENETKQKRRRKGERKGNGREKEKRDGVG